MVAIAKHISASTLLMMIIPLLLLWVSGAGNGTRKVITAGSKSGIGCDANHYLSWVGCTDYSALLIYWFLLVPMLSRYHLRAALGPTVILFIILLIGQ